MKPTSWVWMSQTVTDPYKLVRFVPNFLSLLRVGLTCVFVGFLRKLFDSNSGLIAALVLFGMICLTDLLDGLLARRLGATSRFGAWLDLFADLFYILASFVVLNIYGLVPVWFTVIVAGKFIEFLATSHLLGRCVKNQPKFFADLFGRAAACMYYFLPGMICMLYPMRGIDHRMIVFVLVYCISAITLVSILIRGVICIQARRSTLSDTEKP